MTLIANVCCSAVRIAAKCSQPLWFDPVVTPLSLSAIRLYRRLLSRSTGRTCLFNPSCSQRALEAIETHGFSRGIVLAAEQIDRCGGSFTFSVTTTGETWLVTSDGLRFGPEEIADVVKTGAHRSPQTR
ncbi:membrane protein insertion efficiency factor YidD [Rhodopseudomonas infernalis]|uniref:membrane protein insertion efficiency factor YidD n=1 Tax=Rhodopseudomonas infernalis TaxID=2897386 RepID=UPI003872FE84